MQYQHHFGKKFYLDKAKGYWISSTYPKVRAHVWVWTNNYGEIPKGYHIHHKDENKSNNVIENLEILSRFEHLSMHSRSEKSRKRASDWCAKIRPLTKEWHRSQEGREWHKKHGIRVWLNRKPYDRICKMCAQEYETKTYHQDFCSNKCKSKWRRDVGLDDIERACVNCRKPFMSNKYAKRKFCSRNCSSGCNKNKIN